MRILITLLLLFNICSLFGQSDTLAPKLNKYDNYNDFVTENIRYPKDAAMNGIKGRVDYSFKITQAGCIDSIKIVNSPDDLLSRAVIIVLEKTECKWIPGSIDGNYVSMTLISFITFNLK